MAPVSLQKILDHLEGQVVLLDEWLVKVTVPNLIQDKRLDRKRRQARRLRWEYGRAINGLTKGVRNWAISTLRKERAQYRRMDTLGEPRVLILTNMIASLES